MKVLFLDDEPRIRQGFHFIIDWEHYGYDTFLEAETGSDGLKIIKNDNPELVLLDIKMSDMDGIEVARRAREFGYSGEIIICSGYSDFEYAKSAITYNIAAYLLKPVDPDELEAALGKVNQKLLEKNLLSIYSTQSPESVRYTMLRGLLTGSLNYNENFSLKYQINLSGNYIQLVTVHFDDSIAETDFIMQLTTMFSYHVIIENNIFIIFTTEIQYQRFQSFMQKSFIPQKSSCYILVSDVSSALEALPEFYKQANSILKDLFYYADPSGYFFHSEILEKKKQHNFPIIEQTQAIIQSALIPDNHAALNLFTENYYYYLRSCKPERNAIYTMLSNSYRQIICEFQDLYPILLTKLPNQQEFITLLCQKRYLYEYILVLKDILIKMSALINEYNQQNPCTRLCQYIRLYYMCPLKLETLSEQFGYNSNYLGRLFKQKTNVSFNSYLTQIRISHAKELLEKGLSVQETANRTGLSNLDYFTKKFKEAEGCSPFHYQKHNSE